LTEDQGKGYSIPTQVNARQAHAQREAYAVPAHDVRIADGIAGASAMDDISQAA